MMQVYDTIFRLQFFIKLTYEFRGKDKTMCIYKNIIN